VDCKGRCHNESLWKTPVVKVMAVIAVIAGCVLDNRIAGSLFAGTHPILNASPGALVQSQIPAVCQ